MEKRKVELMAPAGNWESLQAAINAGADSVYFGIDQLNMRARASMNFTPDDLPEIAVRCNKANVKTYLTLNTIIYDHDLSVIKTLVNAAKDSGISAIIASDQAVINYAASQDVEVHISTQLNITNIETVKFYSHFADVMVLSRELSLNQIKKIVDQIKKEEVRGPSGELIQIEIFGHGALCVAVSGKCYMSLHTNNSSANRGACVQNCRRTYTVIDKETGDELDIDNEYIMSPKDLCTVDFLDQVVDTGITVLKIEGRGRAPEYVKTVIETYRSALDSLEEGTYTQEKIEHWMEQLNTVYNRGFWSGYYLGQKLGEFHNASGSKATQKKVYLGKGVHYFPRVAVGEFKIEAQHLKVNDTILITGPTTGVYEQVVEEMMVDEKRVEVAKKGDNVTFPVNTRIRNSDKIYKIVKNED
ncbi:MAG: U32 family peptidase [Crocinitomicaceae bacterium]|nr:U32 family peptidase [Crocinitomicaceae bacterium]